MSGAAEPHERSESPNASSDLVSWLRSQLDADEAIARAAMATAPTPWTVDQASHEADFAYLRDANQNAEGQACGICGVGMLSLPVAAHAAHNHPTVVLRTVAAHRAILDAYEDQMRRKEANSRRFVRLMNAPAHVKDEEGLTGVKTHGWELGGRVDALRHSVQLLASIYESRPGFDPSWRADP